MIAWLCCAAFLISQNGFHDGLVGTNVASTDLVVGKDHVFDFQVDLEYLFLFVRVRLAYLPVPKPFWFAIVFSFYFPLKRGEFCHSNPQGMTRSRQNDTTFGVLKYVILEVSKSNHDSGSLKMSLAFLFFCLDTLLYH